MKFKPAFIWTLAIAISCAIPAMAQSPETGANGGTRSQIGTPGGNTAAAQNGLTGNQPGTAAPGANQPNNGTKASTARVSNDPDNGDRNMAGNGYPIVNGSQGNPQNGSRLGYFGLLGLIGLAGLWRGGTRNPNAR